MESGTTAMEAITALLTGPVCLMVAVGAVHECSWRHPLQIILCTMQLYGLIWFTLQPIYSETGLEGHFSSDPVSSDLINTIMNALNHFHKQQNFIIFVFRTLYLHCTEALLVHCSWCQCTVGDCADDFIGGVFYSSN